MIRILPFRSLLLDDRVLVALLVEEWFPIEEGAPRFTTLYFYYRLLSGSLGLDLIKLHEKYGTKLSFKVR